ESAFPRPLDQRFGDLNRGNSRAPTIGEGDQLVVPFDEALLDLLLGCGDHRMGKALSEVHGHQGDNLHGLARTRGLPDKDVFGSPADIGHQSHLIWTELFCWRFHAGQSSPNENRCSKLSMYCTVWIILLRLGVFPRATAPTVTPRPRATPRRN